MRVPPSSDASEKFGQCPPPANSVPAQEGQLFDSEARTHVDLRPAFCLCGCGQQTPKHFVPGHNQRLRGNLTRAHKRGERVLVHSSFAADVLVSPADAAEALGPGWLAWVAPDVEVSDHAPEVAVRAALAVAADVFEAEWGDL